MTSSWLRNAGTLLLVLAAQAPAHGQAAQFPSTPAGQQLSQLLAAFNTGDKDTMRKYLEANFPERLTSWMTTCGFDREREGSTSRKWKTPNPCG